MKINKINQDKIILAIELVCPMLKEKLITEAFIVGSVAKGTAKPESDIDIYLINPLFESHNVHTLPDENYPNVKKFVDYLHKIGVKFKKSQLKGKAFVFYYQLYKGEQFHLMYDYESESIKKAGEYLEITEERFISGGS